MSKLEHFRAAIVTAATLCMLLIPSLLFARSAGDRRIQLGQPYAISVHGGPLTVKIIGGNSTDHVSMVEHALPDSVTVTYNDVAGKLTVNVQAPATAAATAAVDGSDIELKMPRYEFVAVANTTGPITVDNMSTEHLTLNTSSGYIDVQGSNGRIDVASTTGNQSYRNIFGALNVKSTGGSITVDHEVGLVNLKSGSGAISGTNIMLQTTSSFVTESGNITMSLWNNLYGCTFHLSSADGQIKLGQLHGKNSLDWGHGSVAINGTTTTGSIDIQ